DRVPDGQIRRGVAHALQIVEVPVGVPRFAFGGLAEVTRNLRVTFDVGDLREVEVAAVGLGFASEGGLQVFLGLAAFEVCHETPCCRGLSRRGGGEFAEVG